MELERKYETRWLPLVVALALLLRLIRLGTWSYWQDEAHLIMKSENLAGVWRGDMVSNHPPLFTALGTLWRAIGLGNSEWTMRLMPALLGVGGVVAIFFVGKKLFDSRTGILAAFLLAISPFHIHHSQDLKEYILFPLTGTITVYLLYAAMEKNRWLLWASYALAAAASCYSDLFASLLLVAINVWALAQLPRLRDRIPGWVAGNVAGALLFLPQLQVMLLKAHNIFFECETWWVSTPTVWTLAFYLKAIAFGYSDHKPLFWIALLVYFLLGLVGIRFSLMQNRKAAGLLLLWFGFPVTFAYVFSHTVQGVFLLRALLPFAIPFMLWVALAVSRCPTSKWRSLAVAGLALLAVVPLYEQYQGTYPPLEFPHRPGVHPPLQYRQAADLIRSKWESDDIVVHSGTSSWLSLYHYLFAGTPYRDTPQYNAAADSAYIALIRDMYPVHKEVGIEKPGARVPLLQEIVSQWTPRKIQTIAKGQRRIWLLFTDFERAFLGGNSTRVWRWLDAHYRETFHETVGGMEVFLFEFAPGGMESTLAQRDEDDGVRALLTPRTAAADPYVKWLPDNHLHASSVESRRGSLLLQFEEEPCGATTRLTSDADTRSVFFAVSNRLDLPVQMRCEVVASDLLVNLAALYDSAPAGDVWQCGTTYEPRHPSVVYELTVAQAHLIGTEGTSLEGAIPIPPGTYASATYCLGMPGDTKYRRAALSLQVGSFELFEDRSPCESDVIRWAWLPTAPVSVPVKQQATDVRLTALGIDDGGESWADVGYTALYRIGLATQEESPSPRVPIWSADVELAAEEIWGRSIEMKATTRRIDVWVYEQEEGGHAHHIFRVFPEGGK